MNQVHVDSSTACKLKYGLLVQKTPVDDHYNDVHKKTHLEEDVCKCEFKLTFLNSWVPSAVNRHNDHECVYL